MQEPQGLLRSSVFVGKAVGAMEGCWAEQGQGESCNVTPVQEPKEPGAEVGRSLETEAGPGWERLGWGAVTSGRVRAQLYEPLDRPQVIEEVHLPPMASLWGVGHGQAGNPLGPRAGSLGPAAAVQVL